MSTSVPAKRMPVKPTRITVTPRRPQGRVERLASTKPGGLNSIKRGQSIGPRPLPRPTTHPKTSSCPNPSCPAPNIVEDEGQKVCSGCGTVVSESNIVSEVSFGESASGAAVVQGAFVGEDQTHVRSYGPSFQRGGGMESRELTEQTGNRYINALGRNMSVPESTQKAANQVFKLAVGLNFIQGRRTKTVAAVCLYIACRRQTGNTIMLIDFADNLMVNVFKLGRTYKALLDELRLGGNVFLMNPIEPESFIYRFAKQLEFGSSTMLVASEAVRIVQRMNRDWMTTGRRPAGVCGAALILAARMNNFRRTVREVVYVVKVTEITITQRLNEFSSTESGELTVDQFRSVQLENAHDPPSFTRAREGRKPVRGTKRAAPDTAAEIEDDLPESDVESEADTSQPLRVDADGFAIPNIPIDPAITGAAHRRSSITKAVNEVIEDNREDMALAKAKGKAPRKQPPEPTKEQIEAEDALEDEIRGMLTTGSTMVDSAVQPARMVVSDDTEIDELEFKDDPEVVDCLLSPAEVDIKERIWVSENKEYLRTQQAKNLKRALAEALNGGAAPKPRKRRKGRLGDVTYLEGDGGEGRETRATTPAEATRRMLETRGFSRKINYSLLESIYGTKKEESPSDAADDARSRTSRSRSVTSRRSASIAPPDTPRRAIRGATRKSWKPSHRLPSKSPAPAPPAKPSGGRFAVPTPPSTAPTATQGGNYGEEVVRGNRGRPPGG
ncbi:hypothetical protein N7468_004603 [Penicillium chermesinum]|uniref:B-related factor 1 n=1 Tax=Penicillium chermesinum TaxID=63820 RepID=A0A9W9P8V6_9EURO|nr:uncharacterized protein N7468_004603 [Penicillium chermesinum]KAJ5239984.1 hypothetical protein N7468_004603 [Penicillium chermesinum]